MPPYSRATVVLPVPGGPEKTRWRLTWATGMPSWARRWLSWFRLTRLRTWLLTSARPTRDSSSSRGPSGPFLAASGPPPATSGGRVSPQASGTALPALLRPSIVRRSLSRVCRSPAPRLSRTVQSATVTGSALSIRIPSPTLPMTCEEVRVAREPLARRTPWAPQSVMWTRRTESSPPLSTVMPPAEANSIAQSRTVPRPSVPTETVVSSAALMTVSRMSGLPPEAIRTAEPPARSISQCSSRPRPSSATSTPLPPGEVIRTRRSSGSAPVRMRTATPVASLTSSSSNSAVESSSSRTAPFASPQSRTAQPIRVGELELITRTAGAAAVSNSQCWKVPRERSLTTRPLPLVREVRQFRNSGSALTASMMPGPEVSLTETFSRDGRAELVM